MEALREFEGKDLEEAIDAAARSLGIDADAVHFEIVDEGRRGILGLGARQVRIRVEMPERHVEPPPIRAGELLGTPEAPARPPRGARRERVQKRPNRRGRRREPSRTAAPAREADPTPLPDWARDLEQTLARMFRLMEFELEVRAAVAQDGVRVELSGPDRKAMLAKDGELLTELNFLVNRMSRRAWPDAGRIRIECDGFRNRREEEVVELTREVAEQVSRTGRPKRLHPMNPYERRLVHMTIQDFPDLVSRSEGDGFLKRVRVAPREEASGT